MDERRGKTHSPFCGAAARPLNQRKGLAVFIRDRDFFRQLFADLSILGGFYFMEKFVPGFGLTLDELQAEEH